MKRLASIRLGLRIEQRVRAICCSRHGCSGSVSRPGWQRGFSETSYCRFEAERRKQETSKHESAQLRWDVLTLLVAEADERGDSKMAASLRDVAESLAASERARREADS